MLSGAHFFIKSRELLLVAVTIQAEQFLLSEKNKPLQYSSLVGSVKNNFFILSHLRRDSDHV